MKLVKFFIIIILSSCIFTGCKTTTVKPSDQMANHPVKQIENVDVDETNTVRSVSANGGVLKVYASKAYVDNLVKDILQNRSAFEAVKKLDPFEYNYIPGVTPRSFEHPVLADPHVGFAWNTIPFVIDAATNHLNLGYNNINIPPEYSSTNTPAWYNGGFTYGADNTNRSSFIVGQRNDSKRGSFVAAYDSKGGNHDFIFGRYVENENGCYNFVFNGDWDQHYEGKGIGSFAVNPVFGLKGFYIGEKNLPTILNDFITDWENKTLGMAPRDGKTKLLREENAELKERVAKLEADLEELKTLLLGINEVEK